jgi:CRISPR/Cas system-associated protein Csm6
MKRSQIQFRIMIAPEFQAELEAAAVQYGRKSGNKIAEEVLVEYFEFWRLAEEAKRAEKERQRAALFGVKPAEKRRAG